MEVRTELCAVDAAWMIGNQRVCGFHLRELFERGFFEGSYADLLADFSGDASAVERRLAQDSRPWSEWHRYSQAEARSWSASAKEHGLA